MKIAISIATDSLDGPYDPRFGRAAYFCVVDTATGTWEATPNPAINASGGAGVQASQIIAEKGAEVAISGDFGPNAYMTLSAAGVRMFLAPIGETLTGQDLLDRYAENQLQEVQAPTHGGHHGRGR